MEYSRDFEIIYIRNDAKFTSSVTDIAKGMKEFRMAVCSSFGLIFFYMIYITFNQIVFLAVQRFRAFFGEVLI